MAVQESFIPVASVVSSSEIVSDASAHGHMRLLDEHDERDCNDSFTNFETDHLSTVSVSVPNPTLKEIIIMKHTFLKNPALIIDEENVTFDPASHVDTWLSMEDKEKLLKTKPYQPPESVLSVRKKQIGEYYRHCSQEVFFHKDRTRRKWISYSLSKNCRLYCILCLLFTDSCSRREHLQHNQGKVSFYYFWVF